MITKFYFGKELIAWLSILFDNTVDTRVRQQQLCYHYRNEKHKAWTRVKGGIEPGSIKTWQRMPYEADALTAKLWLFFTKGYKTWGILAQTIEG